MAVKIRATDLFRRLPDTSKTIAGLERQMRVATDTGDDLTCVLAGSLSALLRECDAYLSAYEDVVGKACQSAPTVDEQARLDEKILVPLLRDLSDAASATNAESQLISVVAKAWQAWSHYEKEDFTRLGCVATSNHD